MYNLNIPQIFWHWIPPNPFANTHNFGPLMTSHQFRLTKISPAYNITYTRHINIFLDENRDRSLSDESNLITYAYSMDGFIVSAE